MGEPKFGEWRPIETAPKNGKVIIGYSPRISDKPVLVSWREEQDGWAATPNGLIFTKTCEPTHWMPLPPPPEEEPQKCPWCGDMASVIDAGWWGDTDVVDTGRGPYYVKCKNDNCRAHGPAVATRGGATHAWNRIRLAPEGDN